MKKSRKKLTLHRETLGNLADDRLSEVGGAKSEPPSFCATCGSCACPSVNLTECCNTNLGCVQTYRC